MGNGDHRSALLNTPPITRHLGYHYLLMTSLKPAAIAAQGTPSLPSKRWTMGSDKYIDSRKRPWAAHRLTMVMTRLASANVVAINGIPFRGGLSIGPPLLPHWGKVGDGTGSSLPRRSPFFGNARMEIQKQKRGCHNPCISGLGFSLGIRNSGWVAFS